MTIEIKEHTTTDADMYSPSAYPSNGFYKNNTSILWVNKTIGFVLYICIASELPTSTQSGSDINEDLLLNVLNVALNGKKL